MTIEQEKKFYKEDKQKYKVFKNKDLLNWLGNAKKNGYHSLIEVYEMQKFIDFIKIWYEIKYPNFYVGQQEEKKFSMLEIKKHIETMNMYLLMLNLQYDQLLLLKCNYRSKAIKLDDEYRNGIIKKREILLMDIYEKDTTHILLNKFITLHADGENGKIVRIDGDLKKYINTDNTTLDELLSLFKEKYTDILDFKELEECIYDHNCDIELKNILLQLIALNLLYSKSSIPEVSYQRAKIFINEFNKEFNLNLSAKEIDDAFYQAYDSEKRKRILFKR